MTEAEARALLRDWPASVASVASVASKPGSPAAPLQTATPEQSSAGKRQRRLVPAWAVIHQLSTEAVHRGCLLTSIIVLSKVL